MDESPGRSSFLKVGVAASAIAAHASALAGGFVWLDHGDLESGAALARPSQWLALFGHGFARTGFYRPLTALSLSIDGLVGAPWLYHATNLALHAAVAVGAFVVAELFGAARQAAALAALLFAVHPAASLVVDGIAFRPDLLAAGGLMLLAAGHLRDRPALAAAGLLLGALSKETVFVLGPLFALLLGKKPRLWFWEGVAFALAVALRIAFAPAWRSSFPPVPLTGSRLAGLARTAALIVFPIDRPLCTAFPLTPLLDWHVLAGLGVAVAVGIAAIRYRAHLFALCLLPSLSLLPTPRFWSIHYLYLPLAFGAIALARHLGRRALIPGLAVAAAFAAVSFADGRRFHDDRTLFGPEACREGHLYLGDAARKDGDLEGAAREYEKAAAPTGPFLDFSDESAALQNLGTVRLQQGRVTDAEAAFYGALERSSDELTRRRITHNLAAAALARGDPEQAATLLAAEVARPDAMPESVLLRERALTAMAHRVK